MFLESCLKSSETTVLLCEWHRRMCFLDSLLDLYEVPTEAAEVEIPPLLFNRGWKGAALVAVLTVFCTTARKELNWCHKVYMELLVYGFFLDKDYFFTSTFTTEQEKLKNDLILFCGLILVH